MKTLKLIALAAFALLFSQCKTTAPTAPSGPAPSVIEASNIQTMTRSNFFKFADSTKGDPWKAIMLTANWVKTQPNVQAVDVRDSTYINIQLKSGMTTTFFFDQIGADSISLSRGGHNNKPVTLSQPRNGILSKNNIDNHNVLFYGACDKEFYSSDQLSDILYLLDTSHAQLKTKMLHEAECTPQIAETFGNYGLVIIDSHGFPDGYLTGTRISFDGIPKSEDVIKTAIINQSSLDTYNKLLTGEVKIAGDVRVNTIIPQWQKYPAYYDSSITFRLMTTTKYISELPSMPNTIIFGNTCYSGASQITESWFTTPIQTAWQNKNVISYYGYTTADGLSAPVNNLFARVMLDTFIRRLAYALDSTGIANLQQDGSEYADPYQKDPNVKLFFRHFGADDYSYKICGDSLLDTRDGKKYATVCIGKQVWMAQNLNYNAPGSISYNNDPANGAIYGRLYDWTTMTKGDSAVGTRIGVQGVCPKGWHVPSGAEWQSLINFLGGSNVAGGMMKATSSLWQSPNTGATNSSGFSAIPGGSSYPSLDPGHPGIVFVNIGTNTFLGSCSGSGVPGSDLIYILGNNSASISFSDTYNKTSTSSCRCVKDP